MKSCTVAIRGDHPEWCIDCQSPILKGELFFTVTTYYLPRQYHLKCFKPKPNFPLDFQQLISDNVSLCEAELAAAKKTVDNWNREFIIKVPRLCLRKAVHTESGPSRRRLVEVFVYLKPTEIDLLAAFACKEWFHVSRDEELWRRQYLALFPPPAKDCSYRELMIVKTLESCWHCEKQLTLREVSMVCPLRTRWLCCQCSDDSECRIAGLVGYCRGKHVSPKLVKFLGVPVFLKDKVKSIYIEDMRIRIIPHAQLRHQRLLEVLEADYSSEFSPALMQMIRNFDIEEVYGVNGYVNLYEKPLAEFLGKIEAEEDFNRSVKQFMNSLMRYKE